MRVAVLSRRFTTSAQTDFPAYGVWTEAEDVLIRAIQGGDRSGSDHLGSDDSNSGRSSDGVDTADLVELPYSIQHARIRLRRQAGRALRAVAGPDAAVPATPLRWRRSKSPAGRLSGHYDLIVLLAYSVWDLPLVERLGRLRKHSDRVAVWFLETWPSAYEQRKVASEPFHLVDHIFVGLDVAVEPLSAAIERAVHYLPLATDVVRFGPTDVAGPRPVDLFVPGRRDAAQHRAMLDWAAAGDRLYLYDTVEIGAPADLQGHRDALGDRYASSKVSVCNYAKMDETAIVGHHRAMPGRLWEALAAGCALVGEPPSVESQRAVFGTEVVTALPDAIQDYPAFLDEVIANREPEAIAEQVRMALSGHDWSHRWSDLFDRVGLTAPVGLQARIGELADRSAGVAEA